MWTKHELLLRASDGLATIAPDKLRRSLANDPLVDDLFRYGGRSGVREYCRRAGVRRKWVQPESGPAVSTKQLSRELGAYLVRTKQLQRTVSPAYLPAATWASILETEWSDVLRTLEAEDWDVFDSFLRGFFRNGAISGFWGDYRMFANFESEAGWAEMRRLLGFVRQLETWRREIPDGNLDDLDEARVGQPWGYDVEGRLVVEPAFEYHLLALQIRQLVAGTREPVVLEIGGGYGGLARQILRTVPDVHYIGLDLPENMTLQAWYLTLAIPDRNVVCGFDDDAKANAVLLPNWAIENLALPRVDMVVNVHSFGEMQRTSLETYFREIRRLAPMWVYHDNLGSPRRDDLHGIPSTAYPALHGYRLISARESRWPRYDRNTFYPCREHLLVREAKY